MPTRQRRGYAPRDLPADLVQLIDSTDHTVERLYRAAGGGASINPTAAGRRGPSAAARSDSYSCSYSDSAEEEEEVDGYDVAPLRRWQRRASPAPHRPRRVHGRHVDTAAASLYKTTTTTTTTSSDRTPPPRTPERQPHSALVASGQCSLVEQRRRRLREEAARAEAIATPPARASAAAAAAAATPDGRRPTRSVTQPPAPSGREGAADAGPKTVLGQRWRSVLERTLAITPPATPEKLPPPPPQQLSLIHI